MEAQPELIPPPKPEVLDLDVHQFLEMCHNPQWRIESVKVLKGGYQVAAWPVEPKEARGQ